MSRWLQYGSCYGCGYGYGYQWLVIVINQVTAINRTYVHMANDISRFIDNMFNQNIHVANHLFNQCYCYGVGL